jgi:hypothetical protein
MSRFGEMESTVPHRERIAMVNFKADQCLPGVEKKNWEDVKEDYLSEADVLLKQGGYEKAQDMMQDSLHQIFSAWGWDLSPEEIIPWQAVYLDPRPLTQAEKDWALGLEAQLKKEGKL